MCIALCEIFHQKFMLYDIMFKPGINFMHIKCHIIKNQVKNVQVFASKAM
jgi:hypothetical protein